MEISEPKFCYHCYEYTGCRTCVQSCATLRTLRRSSNVNFSCTQTVTNLIHSIKYIEKKDDRPLNQLSSTHLIWIDPRIKFDWFTWTIDCGRLRFKLLGSRIKCMHLYNLFFRPTNPFIHESIVQCD